MCRFSSISSIVLVIVLDSSYIKRLSKVASVDYQTELSVMSCFQALVVLVLCAKEAVGAALPNISHCYNLTENEVLVAIALRSGLSFLSLVLSIPIVSLRIAQMCTSQETVKNIDRMIIYISMATTLYAFTQSLQWFHIKAKDAYCTVLGSVVEYACLLVLAITACVGCHLSLLFHQTRCLKVAPESTRRQEAVSILVTVLLPLLFIPWPFVYNLYGESGAWCWIKLADDSCKPIMTGVLLSIVLYYAWVAVLLPFTVIVVLAVLAILCLRRGQRPHSSIYALLGYMSVFILTTVASGTGGVMLLINPNVYGYLLVQTLSEPIFTLLSTVVVLVQICWSCCHSRSVYGYYDLDVASHSGIY